MDEIETDYDNEHYESWKRSAATQRLLRAYQGKLSACLRELESHASHSDDANVRAAHAKVLGCRVLIAELQGHDTVGGQQ